MTKAYFWRILFRYEAPGEVKKLLDTDEIYEGKRQEVKTLYTNTFEADSTAYNCPLPAIEGQYSLCLDAERQFSPPFEVPLSPGQGDWLRASATFRCEFKEWNYWQMTQFIVRFMNGEAVVKERAIRVYRFLESGETKRLHIDSELPEEAFDKAVVFFWNADGATPIAIDELEIEVFSAP